MQVNCTWDTVRDFDVKFWDNVFWVPQGQRQWMPGIGWKERTRVHAGFTNIPDSSTFNHVPHCKALDGLSFPTHKGDVATSCLVVATISSFLVCESALQWKGGRSRGCWVVICRLWVSVPPFMGHGCSSRGLGCHWWLRFVVGGGRLVCGWVCHHSWTLVAVLGSWVIVVGAGWLFVSGWAIVCGQHFPFEGYGPSLVVLGHGCWWSAHLWLDRPVFEGGDCRFGLLGHHLGLLCHHSWPGSLLVCHIGPLCLRVMLIQVKSI